MADHHGCRQGKSPIYSSQAPGHSMVPKGSYSSYYPGTTAACPTTQVVQTHSYKYYSRLEESKHKHWEHSVAVGASALTEKHQIKKPQIEKHHVIEKHRIESDPKLAHGHRIKDDVAVASGAHAVCERHEKKKARKPKEATSGKKHGHHLF